MKLAIQWKNRQFKYLYESFTYMNKTLLSFFRSLNRSSFDYGSIINSEANKSVLQLVDLKAVQ